jgi:hypothetical protein
MRTSRVILAAVAALLVAAVWVTPAAAQGPGQSLTWTGINYTKWLWGNQRYDGSAYNFTTIPGDGYGDNGQATEFELLVSSKPSKYVEVSGRLKARFNQNFWTNFGGFGGGGVGAPGSGDCIGGDCGEFDPRSAEYIKFRGLTVTLTPGYNWVDRVTIGSTDLGMFDPFTIGKIRYIDRDNGKAVLFQGSFAERKGHYDFVRVSLPRLWAGPNFETGEYTSADGAYGLQLSYAPNAKFDVAGIYEYVNDIEVANGDFDVDDGREIATRFRNDVAGIRLGFHPNAVFDARAVAYFSSADSNPEYGAPANFFGLSGFSPVIAGRTDDSAFKVNFDLNDPFSNGLSFNLEYFDIGAEYTSIMAARRESDVLLTEGFDGTWAFPGPANAAFGVFAGNPTRIGYGGWQGNAQQVATLNVDNEFTDFEEPLAETVIGWKGFTVAPTFTTGDLELNAEYTYVDYNTNWQAFGNDNLPVDSTVYPVHELDSGVGHNFRSAFAPFQDKETNIIVLKGNYFIDAGNGIELFGKLKWIDEQDKRLNDSRYLPYLPGDCPGGGAACAGNTQSYGTFTDPETGATSPNSTASIYGNPPVITVNGVTGYQWKPFDSISDDDRDMDYKLYQLGAGYQLTDELYASVTVEVYDVALKDGNTAFQAYNLHELASGQHDKTKLMLYARYILGGAEFGLHYEYDTGEFDPDFGGGYVVQYADADTAASNNVPVNSAGFRNRFGGWVPGYKREFNQQRLKGYMKVRF